MAMQDLSEDVVRLATATNPAQAHIWEQALNAAGIRAKVVGDFLDAGIGDVPGITAELWVHREDVQRAEEVLRQGQEVAATSSTEDEEDQR